MVKGAIQEMTNQVVSAIQAAFKSASKKPPTEQEPDRLESKRSSKRVTKAKSQTSVKSNASSKRHVIPESSDSSGDSDTDVETDSDVESIATSTAVRVRSSNTHIVKLPAFTGKEKWEVWHNRFEAVARHKRWNEEDKLQELLPRLQGEAGEFAFDQLSDKTLDSYKKLVKELKNRFGVIEHARTYKLQFSRRKQQVGETPEKFAAELKRIYDKAYKNRDSKTRQEDLLQRFLLGLHDYKARIYIELHREPKSIEEAVQEVTTYMETMKNPNQNEDAFSRKTVRQIKRNQKDDHYGKLNGKKPVETQPREHSNLTQKPSTSQSSSNTVMVNKDDLRVLIDEIIESKKPTFQKTPFYRTNLNKGQPNSQINNQGNVTRNSMLCFYCGQPGHFARSCYSNPDRRPEKYTPKNVGETFNRQPWTDQKVNQKVSIDQKGSSPVTGAPQGYALN